MLKLRLFALALAGVGFVSTGNAQTFTEFFTNDPAANGWSVFGDTNLFQWDSTNHDLAVTWDSSQPNSYFYHALPLTLNKETDFMLAFDLTLTNAMAGSDPTMPFTFELAIGFLNLTNATNSDFLRGTGLTPNLIEFDYFPDDGLGDTATVGPTIISADDDFNFAGDTFPVPLTLGHLYHVQMTYVASNQTLVTIMMDIGNQFGPINQAVLNVDTNFDDFQLDQLAIMSYSGADQDPEFMGSIFAQGTVANFIVAVPPPVENIAGAFSGGVWQVQCTSSTNWLYTLQRTLDFQTWTPLSAPVTGNGGTLTLQDTNPPPGPSFYRVVTRLP